MSSRVTIAFTRYAEPNWLIFDAVTGVARQRDVKAEVLFLDQKDDPEARAFVENASTRDILFKYLVIPAVGSSFARNQALKMADNDVVLFMDSDAVPQPTWAHEMLRAFDNPAVAVVGSQIIPRWHKKPLLIARAPMIRTIYSLLELGSGEVPTTRLWGVGFGMHKRRLGSNAYWDERIGRSYGNLLSGEDVDICLRAREMGLETIYNGAAIVEHQILPERISYRWVMRRIYYSGIERILTDDSPLPSASGRVFMDYVAYILTLPALLLGFWRGWRIRERTQR